MFFQTQYLGKGKYGSKMNTTSSCSKDYSTVGKLSIGFIAPIIITSTVLLHGGIVFFEKWGYDPQKRNLYNMLIASLSKSSAALVVYTMAFGSIRILVGPLEFMFGLGTDHKYK